MRPISSKYLGSNGIEVFFWFSGAVIRGWITKQVGSKRFVVTDGTVTTTALLTDDSTIANKLLGYIPGDVSCAGFCSIAVKVSGSNIKIPLKSIQSKIAFGINGTKYLWANIILRRDSVRSFMRFYPVNSGTTYWLGF